MKKLIITADIHGRLNAWRQVKAQVGPDAGLVVAGDLFDTKYGSPANPDFKPDDIKADLATVTRPLFYVYGNCDTPWFFKGYDYDLEFTFSGRTIFLHHGHRRYPDSGLSGYDIVISGHTHIHALERIGKTLFMNPGSCALPRKGRPAFGIIQPDAASLVDLSTGQKIAQVKL